MTSSSGGDSFHSSSSGGGAGGGGGTRSRHHQTIAEHFVVVGFDFSHNDDVLDHIIASSSSSSTGIDRLVTGSSGGEVEIDEDEFLREIGVDWTDVQWDASLLDTYPPQSQRPIPEGLEYFCFPEGLKWTTTPVHPTFHSFIHTSEEGARMIGSVLTFSEELTDEQYHHWMERLRKERASRHGTISSSEDKVEGSGGDKLGERERVGSHGREHDRVRYFVRKGICILSSFSFTTSFKIFLKKLYQLTHSIDNEREREKQRQRERERNGGQSVGRERAPSIPLLTSYIPIERYICNFIDDIPSPPAGKVDITYFLCDLPISFTCPPLNEPNVWTGFPLFPLFECLSSVNICHVLAVILIERQILFISSQYSLLTLCAEGITSLIYPLRWVHAYIPILPTALLGALGAPFPFIFGIHAKTYEDNHYLVAPETVKIFLDDDMIDFGALGPPPALPDRRAQKLLTHIQQVIPWYHTPTTTSSNSGSYTGVSSGGGGSNGNSGGGSNSGSTHGNTSGATTGSSNTSVPSSTTTGSTGTSLNSYSSVVQRGLGRVGGAVVGGIVGGSNTSGSTSSSGSNNSISRSMMSAVVEAGYSYATSSFFTTAGNGNSLMPTANGTGSVGTGTGGIRETPRERWKRERLRNYDNAMENIIDTPPSMPGNTETVKDAVIREGFLKFFVAVLKDYKK